jgi:hypothetical protein
MLGPGEIVICSIVCLLLLALGCGLLIYSWMSKGGRRN